MKLESKSVQWRMSKLDRGGAETCRTGAFMTYFNTTRDMTSCSFPMDLQLKPLYVEYFHQAYAVADLFVTEETYPYPHLDPQLIWDLLN